MDPSIKIKIEGEIPQEYILEICRLHGVNPFAALLEIEIDALKPGYCRLRQIAGKQCANSYGGVHGGVIATLADISMGVSLRTVGLQPVTAELTVNYLGPAQVGEELVAEGQVVHKGSRLVLTECLIKSGERTIGRGKGIFVSRGRLAGSDSPPAS